MKRWIMACLLAPLMFAACAEENKNSAVPVAPSPGCMNGTTYCDSSQYGYHQGYAPYPQNPYFHSEQNAASAYRGFNFSNLCDCPAGQRPVYNGTIGLGCVNASNIPGPNSALYWSWQARNGQWVNVPQISNAQGYAGNSSSCYKDVAQSCLVDQPNSCGAGAMCRVTGGGSRLGICTTATTTPASPPRNGFGTGATSPSSGSGYR